MGDRYDRELLQQINESVDLFEYASQKMEMKKRGEDYFAHCTKHVDKTPSLCFTPSKNSYHCFSCGRGGYFINFLMDYEDLGFKEAVAKAARLATIDLTKICHSNTIAFLKEMRSLREVREKPKNEYRHEIIDTREYEKYKREQIDEWLEEGITQRMIDLFGCRLDTRQNRIIYPVYDISGNLINIKGRTRYANYKALKIPKYINYYSVGVMDYFQGLNITLPYIKESNEIIIFESVKSVMKAYSWGFCNCASAEKHTLTKEQENLLVKLKVNIVFAYDKEVNYTDKDVWKSIKKLKRVTNVYIIKDPKGLLGDKKCKNAPVDCGREVWEELYANKRKVV